MNEKLFEKLGQRCLGAKEPTTDSRDLLAKNMDIVPETFNLKTEVVAGIVGANKFIGLNNLQRETDQKNTNRCTSYSLWGLILVMTIRRLYSMGWVYARSCQGNMNLEYDLQPTEQWNNQLAFPATAEESSGDLSRSALRALKKYGLVFYVPDNDGKIKKVIVNIENYVQIKNDDATWQEWKKKGHPIYFTKKMFSGTTDAKGYLLETGKERGYHQMFSADFNNIFLGHDAVNSWGDYWNGEGKGTAGIKSVGSCLQPWIITGLTIKIV